MYTFVFENYREVKHLFFGCSYSGFVDWLPLEAWVILEPERQRLWFQ